MPARCNLCVAVPGVIAKQWVSLLVNIADSYVSSLDPRPDLSLPARRVALPYAWWW